MTKMLKITQPLNHIHGYSRHGYRELNIEKEKWERMSSDEQNEFFDSCANVVMNEIQITSFDPDEDHPTIEEEQ